MGRRYGTTINIDDPSFGFLTDDNAILKQAVRMRLSTPTGMYLDDETYGLDVTGLLGEGLDATAPRLGARIAAEVSEDERVRAASATVDRAGTLDVQVEPLDGGELRYVGTVADLLPALTEGG